MATRRKKPVEANVEETVLEPTVEPKKVASKNTKTLRKVPFDTLVAVVNNCPNMLVYASKHISGMIIQWNEYGETQYIELGELNYMRSTDPKFFSENWVVIDESDGYTPEEIYHTISVDRYYKNAVTPVAIDALLEKGIDEIQKEMAKYSANTKRSVYERAVVLMNAGRFDSISKFNAIKESAGIVDVITVGGAK